MSESSKQQNHTATIESGVGASAKVVPGLGYPNNREELSSEPTGWQASKITSVGTPDQSQATADKI